ncbi:MAG: LexA family transcriptional regulator [Bdellovibrionota bacterium]
MSRSKPKARKPHHRNPAFLALLGEHCKKLRVQKGLSIDRVAKESDSLSTSVIHRLESGSRPVSVNSLVRYAEVLEIHPKKLLDFPFEFESMAEEKLDPPLALISNHDLQVRKEAFRTLLPVYSLKAAAGYFGRGEEAETQGWIRAPKVPRLDRNMFVVKAVGSSMLPKIHDGDYLVFRANPVGTRQGKIVLAQYRGTADPDTGGSYTVKKYTSVKSSLAEGSWRHKKIVLSPLNRAYKSIVLMPEDEDDFRIVGEFVAVL